MSRRSRRTRGVHVRRLDDLRTGHLSELTAVLTVDQISLIRLGVLEDVRQTVSRRVIGEVVGVVRRGEDEELAVFEGLDVDTLETVNRGADVGGQGVEVADEILHRLALKRGVLLQRGVQVVHVRRVMLAVMDLHRHLVDVRLERIVLVGKFRECERHCGALLRWDWNDRGGTKVARANERCSCAQNR